MKKQPNKEGREGSVLIFTVWTVLFLGALAVAVSTHVGSALLLAERMRDETAGYSLALAGAEKTAMLLLNDTNAWDGFDEKWSGDPELFRDAALGDGLYSVIKPEFADFIQAPPGDEIFGVSDEESRININKADLNLLTALLRTIGGLKKKKAAEISACIIDWRDENDEILTDGAEKGYYLSLSRPYACRNAAFLSVHELMLVKGMTKTLFDRISPLVTVFGHGKVNINTAGEGVLFCAAVAGSGGREEGCSQLAAKILSYRKGGNSFKDRNSRTIAQELSRYRRLTAQESMVLSRMIKYVALNSTCFHGVSAGRIKEQKKVSAEIDFIFDRARKEFVYWKR